MFQLHLHPNGDHLNDVFRFTAVGMTAIYYFRIYNRYGQLVYNSTDPEKGWDGTWRLVNHRQAIHMYG